MAWHCCFSSSEREWECGWLLIVDWIYYSIKQQQSSKQEDTPRLFDHDIILHNTCVMIIWATHDCINCVPASPPFFCMCLCIALWHMCMCHIVCACVVRGRKCQLFYSYQRIIIKCGVRICCSFSPSIYISLSILYSSRWMHTHTHYMHMQMQMQWVSSYGVGV